MHQTAAGYTRGITHGSKMQRSGASKAICKSSCIQHVRQQPHMRCRSKTMKAHLYPAQIHLPLGPPMCHRVMSSRTVVGLLRIEVGAVLQVLQLNEHPEICRCSDQQVHKLKQRRSRQGRCSITSCIAYR